MRLGSEQPFLFFPEGMDVRWRSFATVVEQAEGGRESLEAVGLLSGQVSPSGGSSAEAPVVAYTWAGGLPGADAVAADLAIRSGGWTAAPVPAPPDPPRGATAADASRLRPPEHEARLLLPWEGAATVAPEGEVGGGEGCRPAVARLPAAAKEVGRRPGHDRSRGMFPPLPPLVGGVLVRRPGERSAAGAGSEGRAEGRWQLVAPEALREAAQALGRALDFNGSGAGPGGGSGVEPGAGQLSKRHVVAAWLDPSLADGRVLLEWAIEARAALYLETDRWSLGGASAWVRPTVVAGDAHGLAAVAAEIRRRNGTGSRFGRRNRLPFGRLRSAVLLGEDLLSEDDRSLFDGRGVALVRPALSLPRGAGPRVS